MTRISIIIPTLNGGTRLERLLQALAAQEGDFDRQIVAIDSGSIDGTVERLREAGAHVIETPLSMFNHGTTRNQALDHASGEFAALLVQDAVPASSHWLQALIAPLLQDDAVAGSFGRQCPWPDASRLTTHYLSKWVAAQTAARLVGPLSRAAFDSMSPADRHDTCAFDNVSSCLRISVWRQQRFRSTPIAEDLEWALDVLLAGHKLAYVPDAVVWHSHERPVAYELQRTYLVHQRLQTLFGLSTVPTVTSLVRAVVSTLPLHAKLIAGEPRARRRALMKGAALAVALPLGQYLGARSAREGRELLRTRNV